MDILFIHPGNRRRIYQGLGDGASAIETPVWAGMAAEYARRRGLVVGILDAEALDLDARGVANAVDAARPHVAAIVVYGHQPNASTQNMEMAGDICREVTSLTVRPVILLFGGHVAALPELTLQEEACDYVATGEGVVTAAELALAVRDNVDPTQRVPGIGWREGVGQGFRPAPPLMDMVPAAYDLMDMGRYRAHNHQVFYDEGARGGYASIYTTLGCPYGCGFCPIQAPFRAGERAVGRTTNSYRFMDPEVVVATIDRLVEDRGVRTLRIDDELFVLNRRHVVGIAERLATRWYADKINIWAYARIDTVRDRSLLDLLRKAGFRWLCYGIESASERVLEGVSKGYRVSETERVVRMTEAAGIEVQQNYIVGLPEDDEESVAETKALALSLNTAAFNVYAAMAYPGSRLYEEALLLGQALPERWGGYSQHAWDTTPLSTKYLSAASVLRLRDDFHTSLATSDRYLGMVERRWGEAARRYVETVLGTRLPRRLLGDSTQVGIK